MSPAHIQLRHLLTTQSLSHDQISAILDTAEYFLPQQGKKIQTRPLLQGVTVFNLFFENSTRTRTTFELAAKKLGADVINLNMAHSSRSKGETDLDTFFTLQAMGADIFVIRHPDNGAAECFAKHANQDVSIINAGDGCHAHPTQGLLDVLTIRQHRPDFENLKIAIIGDIEHSRVARSTIYALRTLGTSNIHVAAPESFLPSDGQALGVTMHSDIDPALEQADVVMGLRIQRERIAQDPIRNIEDYHAHYGITQKRLEKARPNALVMHPGPINRGVEISHELAYSQQSVILEQVRNGIAIRMAVMALIAGGQFQTL